ncbi:MULTISPECIES: DUF3368 domain-containing protein [Limosilactobacillus]|uniref:DUF3368 domain-containing protein n=1 Tax=Limosilactobacillus TaxID=2742598 RepID=UPI002247ECF3|nr:DUF3368 domain-containing protein [Limosilactobacillus pontis]MCX2186260.1 DUF3368 domain-containing protein [Limosilactobacillus pontis]MCX2187946.1 DUF3368 domain-containing protein [Limosilactobacillus pontis]
MSEERLHYSDLSAPAQEHALKSFINYYVKQYRQGSLEILGAKVSNGVMGTINEILNLNKFMDHSELVAESYRLSKSTYVEIMKQLTNVLYQQDGEPVVDWDVAWENQEEQLPSED